MLQRQLYKQLKRFTHYYYAVTGAGKTEMMYEGIRVARQLGFNVAIVSPRVDVVVEISLRIKDIHFRRHRCITPK